jgi:hypothetical protein
MRKHKKLLAVSAACTAVVVLGFAATALASLPAGTKVTGTLKPKTDMIFTGVINDVGIKVTCTSFTSSGTIPSGSPTTMPVANPTITGCKDSLGGTDTITTNSTNGSWMLSEKTVTKKGKTTYKMTLTIPKAGATFTSSILPSCTVTAAPNGPAGVTGKYNGKQTDKVKKAKIPVTGTGCSTSADSTTTATVVFSPAPGPPPF